jgi:hypothetical protein
MDIPIEMCDSFLYADQTEAAFFAVRATYSIVSNLDR